MQLEFINRKAELKELDAAFAAEGLLVLFGRRRIGKTRLLNHRLDQPRPGSMQDLVLNRSAPLYGRARKILSLRPMGYCAFCEACNLDRSALDSIIKFSLVGGVPKYCEFIGSKTTSLQLAEELFFGLSPYLDGEPARILRTSNST